MDTLCKKLLWAALVLVLGQGAEAQEQVSKKIERSYAMTDAGELHLENKYGNINLYGWDKEETTVAINIVVKHRKRENAEELLKRISPVIQESDNYVSIGYEIAEKSSGFFGTLFEKANPFDFNRSNIQIDFKVYLPLEVELNVKNTFGDVIIEDWRGELKADIAHGDLWVNEDLNRATVDMKYGKFRTRNIDYGHLTLKNADLDMEDSKNLRINSGGTEMSINRVASLEFYSSKDEVRLEEAGTIYGTLKFSTLELNKLTKDVDLTLKIADFRISEIASSNADIAIEQESSELNLNITNFAHHFEATLEEGLVRLPKSFEDVDSKMLDKGKKLREIQGNYGRNIQGRISITGKKGVVILKEL